MGTRRTFLAGLGMALALVGMLATSAQAVGVRPFGGLTRSELAGLGFGELLVLLNPGLEPPPAVGSENPFRPAPGQGCSFTRPEPCDVIDEFFGPGGSARFGRVDFDARGIFLPDQRVIPFDDAIADLLREHSVNEQLFASVCSTSIGIRGVLREPCREVGDVPSPGVPEPTAAAVFALGLAGVAARVRRRR